jgi:hypothetical protein
MHFQKGGQNPMHTALRVPAIALLLSSAACYHAIITTGATESSTIVEKPWAPSFIDGLVPPAPLDVSSQCKSGVAKVETQHSFLNGLVGLLTFGIFTPMDIKVTCATARAHEGAAIELPGNATVAMRQHAIEQAAEMVQATGETLYVQY